MYQQWRIGCGAGATDKGLDAVYRAMVKEIAQISLASAEDTDSLLQSLTRLQERIASSSELTALRKEFTFQRSLLAVSPAHFSGPTAESCGFQAGTVKEFRADVLELLLQAATGSKPHHLTIEEAEGQLQTWFKAAFDGVARKIASL